MIWRSLSLIFVLIVLTMPAESRAAGATIAAFPAEFYSTSLEPVRDDEIERLPLLDHILRSELERQGLVVVDTAAVADEAGAYAYLWSCNTCEIGLARRLDARFAAVLWVQKVSNLILNINLRISDTALDRAVAGGSVDIRGNTDESWSRGLRYLLKHRIFPES